MSVQGWKAFYGTLMTREGPASGCLGLKSTHGTLGTGEGPASRCWGRQSTPWDIWDTRTSQQVLESTHGTVGTGEETGGTPRGSLTTTEQEVLSSR